MSVERFMIKRANLASILPAVAAPIIGGLAGKRFGGHVGLSPELGTIVGGGVGSVGGQLLKETLEDRASDVPPGAPYALDPTAADIPPWALQGANMLRPAMKQAGDDHESMADVILGEVPGANPVMEGVKHGPGAAARAFGGMTVGGVGGGLAGTLGAKGIEHLIGHAVHVPGLNMSLSDLLGSVGGAIGATKGLRFMQR